MKILIVTHDLVGEKMAGPAIRCWELAARLSGRSQVVLASKLPVARRHPAFEVTCYQDDAGLIKLAKDADILVVQGYTLRHHPELGRLGKYLVVDLYDPFVFESYPHFELLGEGRDGAYLDALHVLDEQMLLGDYFLCASERQRDMWLGRFCVLGRLTPELFERSPAMTSLIGIVPFGLPDEPPAAPRKLMRGVVPGIGEDDFVLLWGGGVWNWFDPLSVIRAVAEIGKARSDVKLFFMGLKHPNPDIPEMAMATRAVALASELGVKDRLVFFNHGWVDYDRRQSYLLESDAGVSAHFDSLETRFSFRTRVLDYLWAGLPVISTVGDSMAELVSRESLGAVVGYEDVAAWQAAILRLADDPGREAMRARVRRAAERFRWSEVVAPLEAYCAAPYRQPPRLVPQGPLASLKGGAQRLLELGLKGLASGR